MKTITTNKKTITLTKDDQAAISQAIGRMHADMLEHGYGVLTIRYREGRVVEIVEEKSILEQNRT